MNKTIVYETSMTQVPENCGSCTNYRCSLPTLSRYLNQLKKAHKDKRHPSCPLRLVDPQHLEKVK
jgi:hypothetical protein